MSALGPVDRQPQSLSIDEAHVATPPGDCGRQRSSHTHWLGETRVLVTKRSLGLLEQHEAPVMTAYLKPHHHGVPGQGRKAYPPLHIDQQRFQIEVLRRRLSRQPTLSPCSKRAYQDRQLLSRFGKNVFRAMRRIDARHGAGEAPKPEAVRKARCGRPAGIPLRISLKRRLPQRISRTINRVQRPPNASWARAMEQNCP